MNPIVGGRWVFVDSSSTGSDSHRGMFPEWTILKTFVTAFSHGVLQQRLGGMDGRGWGCGFCSKSFQAYYLEGHPSGCK